MVRGNVRKSSAQGRAGEQREEEKVVGRGCVAAQGQRTRECGRGERVKAEREGAQYKSNGKAE